MSECFVHKQQRPRASGTCVCVHVHWVVTVRGLVPRRPLVPATPGWCGQQALASSPASGVSRYRGHQRLLSRKLPYFQFCRAPHPFNMQVLQKVSLRLLGPSSTLLLLCAHLHEGSDAGEGSLGRLLCVGHCRPAALIQQSLQHCSTQAAVQQMVQIVRTMRTMLQCTELQLCCPAEALGEA